jgi:tetratricopeptide (TPR) repeat protein
MLKTNPTNGVLMIRLAQLEEQAGHYGEATGWLEKALTIPPQRVSAGVYLSGLLVRQRDFERAVKVAKDAVSRAPKDLPALYALARAELAAGDTRSARQTLGVMGPVAGFDKAANLDIARLQFMAGDRENAMYTLGKVLQENPASARACAAEAEIAGGGMSRPSKTRKDRGAFSRPRIGAVCGDLAAARDQAIPRSRVIVFAARKRALSVLRLYQAALRAESAALIFINNGRWSIQDLIVLRAVADGRLRAGNLAEARSDYGASARNPNDVEILNNLARVANRQGDKSALGYAERAYQLANTNAAVLDTIGWCWSAGPADRGTSRFARRPAARFVEPGVRYHLAGRCRSRARCRTRRAAGPQGWGRVPRGNRTARKLGPPSRSTLADAALSRDLDHWNVIGNLYISSWRRLPRNSKLLIIIVNFCRAR